MEGEEEENNQHREQNIPENNQVMEVSLVVQIVLAMNHDYYFWVSKQAIVFFEKIL